MLMVLGGHVLFGAVGRGRILKITIFIIRNIHSIVRKMALIIKKAGKKKLPHGIDNLLPESYCSSLRSV